MSGRYTRDLVGERYVTHSQYGPVGKDTQRRTTLVAATARQTAPRGKGKDDYSWTNRRGVSGFVAGYPGGRLKKSIHSNVTNATGELVGTVTADAVRPGQFDGTSYAAAVHEGARTHPIRPRVRHWRRYPGPDGADVFSRGVTHRATRGQPWMREALEAARG